MQTTGILSLNGKPQAVLEPASGAVQRHPEASADASVGDATQRVMALLGAVVRIKITDGRVVVGTFHCVDKQQNVILTDTREFLPLQGSQRSDGKKKKGGKQADVQPAAPQDQDDDEKELWKTGPGRSLGMTLVPGKHIVYIKVRKPLRM
ncbi:hypothetical protein P43SY_008240 [Pythium insidiosum]|uniref:Sm domain-containing protein n=1 Tax=Pythium insidiosum TaxID=114742 RepID=A0AAD5M2P0_PYTIN|nr:hypothetical protein ATCC90586_003473 [Pythium insidiosum]KAJ0402248.1 hypothetical protein P43SY_008240 [Pythium insidiosum]